MAAMLVLQTNPVGVEPISYVHNFFCSHKFQGAKKGPAVTKIY